MHIFRGGQEAWAIRRHWMGCARWRFWRCCLRILALALWRNGAVAGKVSPGLLRGVFLLALLGFLGSLLTHYLDIFYRPRWILFPVCGAIVYAAFINALIDQRFARLGAVLGSRPLVEIGKVSYAVYLIHTFVANAVLRHIPGLEGAPEFVQGCVSTLATLALAFASWRVFEGPINAHKTRFPYPGKALTRV